MEEALEEDLLVSGVVPIPGLAGMVGEGAIPILSAVTSPGYPVGGGLCPTQGMGHILMQGTTGHIPSRIHLTVAVFTRIFPFRRF